MGMDVQRPDPVVIGARITRARDHLVMSQEDLANRVGIGRSSMSRIETGERRLGAAEAALIADALQVPLALLVYPPLTNVVSRRNDAASHGSSDELDDELELFARDVHTLVRDGVLREDADPTRWDRLHTVHDAERMAKAVREHLALGQDPIPGMAEVTEHFGLYVRAVKLGYNGKPGAMVEITDRVAAAVINGSAGQGRRRFTLAHELGHWLVGDAYDADARDAEDLLDSFAAFLLAPRAGVLRHRKDDPRAYAVRVAAVFRMSWSATVRHMETLNELAGDVANSLRTDRPSEGDLALDVARAVYFGELRPGSTSSGIVRAVLEGYRDRRVSQDTAIRMLGIAAEDLPHQRSPDEPSVDVLGPRREVISVPGLFDR